MLTLTHLRFDCRTLTPLNLEGHKAGNNLRNAFANILRRATCTEFRDTPTPEHAAVCPACWLLSANLDPGNVARAYALVPPLPPRHRLGPDERFSFTLTLFGDGFHYLPYTVLAFNEAGRREGVGPGRRNGEGRFAIEYIAALNPVTGQAQPCLTPQSSVVTIPDERITWPLIEAATAQYHPLIRDNRLAIRFLTPTRLEEGGQLYRTPDFSVFFRRLLYRIDQLGQQFAGQQRRDPQEVAALTTLADQVRLVDARTHWHESWSNSDRKGSPTPIGGFTGTAVYALPDWTPLLPWLILRQATQVGKSTVKGDGVYEILNTPRPWWSWLNE